MIRHFEEHNISFSERQVSSQALSIVSLRPERDQDRTKFRERRGYGPQAAGDGLASLLVRKMHLRQGIDVAIKGGSILCRCAYR